MNFSSAESHQEMGSQTLESMLVCAIPQQEKKPRPADMQSLKCPRCDSTNTKFCYYNNYSLSQPRYFCKSCRRYWTKGGTLRNVPVGGGCRKTKRAPSSASSSPSKRGQDQPITAPIPSLPYDSNDLNLAIARLQKQNSAQLGLDHHDYSIWADPNMGEILGNFGPFGPIRGGFVDAQNSGVRNLYCGMESGSVEMENGGMGMGMGIPFEEIRGGATTGITAPTAVTTMKQLQPWQNLDSGRVNWNGFGSSNWYGLLNSPLM